jgi:hypothetical protein
MRKFVHTTKGGEEFILSEAEYRDFLEASGFSEQGIEDALDTSFSWWSPSFSLCVEQPLTLPEEGWEWLEDLPFTFGDRLGYHYRKIVIESPFTRSRF